MKTSPLHLLPLAVALCAGQAVAQNAKGGGSPSGAIVIDQARAEAGGVTAGDAPGFPVTISQPGSYRLMSNLTVSNLSTTGIVITSPGVTLDLNGFELRGVNDCTGSGASISCPADPLSTAQRGSGVLIQPPAGSPATVAIENGSVRGFASYGLRGFDGGERGFTVNRLRVSHNGHAGIGSAAAVTDSVIDRNRTVGIHHSFGVMRNTITHNGGYGMWSCWVRHNVSTDNGAPDLANFLIE